MTDAQKKELIQSYKQRPLTGGVCIIRNSANGRYLLEAQTNPAGSKSRFEFAQMTKTCVHMKLQADWKIFGNEVFTFELLEQIEQKETQTPEEFREELQVLGDLWREKFDPALAY